MGGFLVQPKDEKHTCFSARGLESFLRLSMECVMSSEEGAWLVNSSEQMHLPMPDVDQRSVNIVSDRLSCTQY